MDTTLTSKGQMTLPQAVRQRLGLRSGDKLTVRVQDDDTIVLQRKPPAATIAQLRGLLPKPPRALTLQEMEAGVTAHLSAKHKRAG